MLELPELGDIYESREELNVLIKSASRELGYLVKQSITSERAVRWYCSEKYSGAIRCLGGFRANFQDGQWWWVAGIMPLAILPFVSYAPVRT